MKLLILLALFSISNVFAHINHPDIYNVLGEYDSKEAAQAENYIANDLSDLKVQITPDGEAQVYFDYWDIELELDKDLEFYQDDISECDDYGCSGIYDMEGKISFEEIDGKRTPIVKITMSFYQDNSEEAECEDYECEEENWREWSETYTYRFTGTFNGQLPRFENVNVSNKIQQALEECKKINSYNDLSCANAQKFKFKDEIEKEDIDKLKDYINFFSSQTIDKVTAKSLIRSQVENNLLRLKVFKYKNQATEKYQEIEKNGLKVLKLIETKINFSDEIHISSGYSYNNQQEINILVVEKKYKKVYRFTIK